MDNEKLIAQISSTEDALVDRVNLKANQSTLSSHMPYVEELRKKTIKIDGMAKSRFTKLKIQENFENLKNNLHFEYGDHLILNIKSNELSIYSRWIEGITLKEQHQKEDPLVPEEVMRIKNKLRLWVRIFEHLSFYHTKGVIHGNIKPENILIRDRATVDAEHTYNSEFFDRKTDVPFVVLLDGGYSHLIEFQKENSDYEDFLLKMPIEKKFWLSPESRGFLEGSYKENSDVFSLAAVMAWDFGFLDINKNSLLNSVWSVFHQQEANVFRLGNRTYKWPSRTSLADMLKRLRTILLRALEPLPEKRTITARDIAFEIMLMANRLVDTPDGHPTEIPCYKNKEELPEHFKKEILAKNFEVPEKIISFAIKDTDNISNRLWIEARNKGANKHAIMRNITSGFNIVGISSFYFGIKATKSKIPFYNLDIFCNNLLSYVLYINPKLIQEIRAMFFNLGNQIESIFFVLPSLKNFAEKIISSKQNKNINIIQVQHEIIQNNIVNLIIKIIQFSQLKFIIMDDINRADDSSLSILLNIISSNKIKINWILGFRSDENIDSEINKKNMAQIKQKDVTFSGLKDSRTISYWITKLNNLNKNDAKLLAMLALNPTSIEIESIEALSNKFNPSSGTLSSEINYISHSQNGNDIENDFIPPEESTTPSKYNTQNLSDEKQTKDNLFQTCEVIKRAIHLGLLIENRDIVSGHLVSYYWEHQFVFLSLSLLLSPHVKSEIYESLFNIYHASLKENESLAKIIHISDCLINSGTNQSQIGAYSSLIFASEKLCDIYSAEYVINKFQLLEEKIEQERSKYASILIPKIREKIGDLCRSINKTETAEKYYNAVSWNISSRKRRSLLMLKSFFPSQIRNREARTKEFYRILNIAEKSKFLPSFKSIDSNESLNEIENIIFKIQKKLIENEPYRENDEDQNNINKFNSIIEENYLNPDSKPSEVVQNSNSQVQKALRDKVMSYFLRSCIGWIDNSHIYPYLIRSLHLASENNDGESTIHLLFSLLLTCERNIPIKFRSIILETVTDLAGRIGNTFTLYEVLLIRSWCAFFYDGNLQECKRNLDRINSSFYDLPFAIKQCTKKLQILCEFETSSLQSIENHKNFIQKYTKKFQEYDLADWSIGHEIYNLKSASASLKSIPGDTLFLGNILNEKTDQILLYTHFIIEIGHANAGSLVCNEAKNLNIRQWFVDPSSHIEYVPEKIAVKLIDYSIIKNVDINIHDKFKYKIKKSIFNKINEKSDIFIQKYLHKYKSLFLLNQEGFIEINSNVDYWGIDKAILNKIKIDSAKTQDTEKLHFLAQNALRCGFLWTAYRIAHKARSDLMSIFNEVQEIESNKIGVQQANDTSNSVSLIKTKESSYPQYEKSAPYPEQGVAINYILEFLHNFQHQIQESKFTSNELKEIADSIKKSIPKETDIIESTLAGALKASAKRMQFGNEEDVIEDLENPSAPTLLSSIEDKEQISRLPKAG